MVSKAYATAGLYTMAVFRAYQTDLLKDLDEGGGIGPKAVKELLRAKDLSLSTTKQTASSTGRSMGVFGCRREASVAQLFTLASGSLEAVTGYSQFISCCIQSLVAFSQPQLEPSFRCVQKKKKKKESIATWGAWVWD